MRIFTFGHGRQRQTRGQFGGKILQTVNGQIGAAIEQCLSISFVNKPLPPACASGTSVILSPVF